MKRLGIIQPGKIGDIIICLPIAKYYAERGYEVYWPLVKSVYSHFKDCCDYVKFIPIDQFDCEVARQVCMGRMLCNNLIDISFNLPGSWHNFNTAYFKENADKISFDELKYQIANVPFEEKWNLDFKRNMKREEELYKRMNPLDEEYVIVQWKSSDNYKKVDVADLKCKQIEIGEQTDCVLDWIMLLEKAKGFVMIESCFSNLVDQLDLKQNKVLLLKSNKFGDNPKLKQKWKVIKA